MVANSGRVCRNFSKVEVSTETRISTLKRNAGPFTPVWFNLLQLLIFFASCYEGH